MIDFAIVYIWIWTLSFIIFYIAARIRNNHKFRTDKKVTIMILFFMSLVWPLVFTGAAIAIVKGCTDAFIEMFE